VRPAEVLARERVRCGLPARTKEEALRGVAELVASVPGAPSTEEILAALAERERQGPFSMGRSVAYLHARMDRAPELAVALATCREGVDFRAPDGVPIRVLVLFVIPRRHADLYLQVLKGFVDFFSDAVRRDRVIQADTPEGLLRALAEAP
jgi:mannitol/fructose-specific phosphotransferase system IIA component (Ntr-type)